MDDANVDGRRAGSRRGGAYLRVDQADGGTAEQCRTKVDAHRVRGAVDLDPHDEAHVADRDVAELRVLHRIDCASNIRGKNVRSKNC